jgi:uncharacterized protein
MPRSKIFLPDINVWLAFAVEAHVHHAAAMAWASNLGQSEAALCRITQMGLLRLLTNSHVMHFSVLTQGEAWRAYESLYEDERTLFLPEPDGMEDGWKKLTTRQRTSGSLWTDCYLRAFANLADLKIVTFDKGLGAAQHDALILENRPSR